MGVKVGVLSLEKPMKINRNQWLSNLEVGDKILCNERRKMQIVKALQFKNGLVNEKSSLFAVLTEEDPLQWIGIDAIHPFLP
jgi:hypothetical protein